jgi:hypothetical protein
MRMVFFGLLFTMVVAPSLAKAEILSLLCDITRVDGGPHNGERSKDPVQIDLDNRVITFWGGTYRDGQGDRNPNYTDHITISELSIRWYDQSNNSGNIVNDYSINRVNGRLLALSFNRPDFEGTCVKVATKRAF